MTAISVEGRFCEMPIVQLDLLGAVVNTLCPFPLLVLQPEVAAAAWKCFNPALNLHRNKLGNKGLCTGLGFCP